MIEDNAFEAFLNFRNREGNPYSGFKSMEELRNEYKQWANNFGLETKRAAAKVRDTILKGDIDLSKRIKSQQFAKDLANELGEIKKRSATLNANPNVIQGALPTAEDIAKAGKSVADSAKAVSKAPSILGRLSPYMAGIAIAPDVYNFIRNFGDLNKPVNSVEDLRMPGISGSVAKFFSKSRGGNNKTLPNTGNAQLPMLEAIEDRDLYNSGIAGIPTQSFQGLAPVNNQGVAGILSSVNTQDSDREQTPVNIELINDYISRLQDVNQPYIDALQNYSNNYDDLVRRNFNAQRYFTAMAGLSKNPGYIRLADALNPINNEANKLNTLKLLRDAQAGDVNAINEVMGNLAMAQEMGLPPEAAFANKNLLTMMAARDREANKYQIALENNLMKKYGIDRNYARALAVQGMRGQTALDVANIYMGGGVAPGLNRQGGVQTPYQPLANRQQGGSSLQQAFDMYANK